MWRFWRLYLKTFNNSPEDSLPLQLKRCAKTEESRVKWTQTLVIRSLLVHAELCHWELTAGKFRSLMSPLRCKIVLIAPQMPPSISIVRSRFLRLPIDCSPWARLAMHPNVNRLKQPLLSNFWCHPSPGGGVLTKVREGRWMPKNDGWIRITNKPRTVYKAYDCMITSTYGEWICWAPEMHNPPEGRINWAINHRFPVFYVTARSS